MSKQYIEFENLSISENLYNFVNNEAIPGTGISKDRFWSGLSKVSHELGPKNAELLRVRKKLQIDIDRWHLENYEKQFNIKVYRPLKYVSAKEVEVTKLKPSPSPLHYENSQIDNSHIEIDIDIEMG